jgi:capsid protein
MGLISRVRQWLSGPPSREVDLPGQPAVRGRYDAAQDDGQTAMHWTAADAYDADAANSKTIRQKIIRRSRYEIGNNGQGKGIQLTQANYVVGRGPKLRMQTGNDSFNRMVEAAWNAWAAEVKLARMLRTAVKAKLSDGETFFIIARNPRLKHPVKLGLRGIECEQVASSDLTLEENHIDGVKFDEFGDPLYYEVLRRHPGGLWGSLRPTAEQIPARFVLHLFREDRPGQHRGVGELHPSLNLFANGRRYREAVVAAAENIANFSILLKTQQSPNMGPDPVRPFTSVPIEKSMMTALPWGYDLWQPTAQQPAGSYPEFVRGLACEQARPINMPYNIAAADSSGYSFSGGKLDHLTYFVSVDVEQAEIEESVLEPLVGVWFAEAVLRYGWSVQADTVPSHAWDWPRKPIIDETKAATARKIDLSTGATHRRRLSAEDGWDLDDEDATAATDLGITVQEYRRRLFDAALATKVEQATSDEEPPPQRGARGGLPAATANGNGRVRL